MSRSGNGGLLPSSCDSEDVATAGTLILPAVALVCMSDEEPGTVKKAVRTVTPYYRGRPDAEMTTIGVLYFLGLLILLVPLLPFLVIVWLISKLTGAVAQRAPTDEE